MILKRKLIIPKIAKDYQPPDELMTQFAQLLDFTLLGVIAAPGFGRTSAVAYWLQHCLPEQVLQHGELAERPVCPVWLSLGEAMRSDGLGDLRRFWLHLITALSHQGALENPMPLLQRLDESDPMSEDRASMESASIERLLAELLEALEQSSRLVVMVLDDYDQIKRSDIHDALNFFLDHLPASCRLVVIARQPPPLNLTYRQLTDTYLELNSSHFALSAAVSARLFAATLSRNARARNAQSRQAQPRDAQPANGAGELTPAHFAENSALTQQLHSVTQGWPVAVKLVALSLASETIHTVAEVQQRLSALQLRTAAVTDYVLSEILSQLPASEMRFLHVTAHLNQFTPDLCHACMQVIQRQDDPCNSMSLGEITAQIDRWVKEGLIIEYSASGSGLLFFQFHQLLQAVLNKTDHPELLEQLPELYTLVADYYIKQHQPAWAIQPVAALQDWPWLAGVLEFIVPDYLQQSEYEAIQQSLGLLPPHEIETRPKLLIAAVKVWLQEATLHINPAQRYLELAAQLLQQNPPDEAVTCASARPRSLPTKATCEALAATQGIEHPQVWYQLQGEIHLLNSHLARLQGNTSHAMQLSQASLTLAEQSGAPMRAKTYASLGMNHYLVGALKQGAVAMEQAWWYGKEEHDLEVVSAAAVRLAWVYQWQGDFEASITIYQSTRAWLEQLGHLSAQFVCWQNLMLIAYYREKNQLDQARACWVAIERAALSDYRLKIFGLFVQARLEESLQQYDLATSLLYQVEALYKASGMNIQGFPSIDAALMKLALHKGERHLIDQWLAKVSKQVDSAGVPLSQSPRYRHEELRLTYCRLLIKQQLLAQGSVRFDAGVAAAQLQQTQEILADVSALALQGARINNWLTATLLQAITGYLHSTLLLEGAEAEAVLTLAQERLMQALTQGVESGFLRLFVEEFPAYLRLLLQPLLTQTKADMSEPVVQFVQHCLNIIENEHPMDQLTDVRKIAVRPKSVASPGPGQQTTLFESLSKREQQVLKLMAEGLPNKAIAERLFVGVGTVKTHARNVFGKLMVANRTEAVVIGRKCGLLS